jgi:hypothetical protein
MHKYQHIINKIDTNLSVLDSTKKYHLRIDEGGMLGSPKVTISLTKKDDYYVGKLQKHIIRNYLIGRLSTWILFRVQDWTDKMVIEVIE